MTTIVGAAVVTLLAGGCSTSPSASPTAAPTQPSPMTQGELCDSLESFFSDELHAVDIRTTPISKDPTFTLTMSGLCKLDQGNTPIGRVTARHAPSEPDPTEGAADFEQTTAQSVPVWVRDRTNDPNNPSNSVRFATRVNEWNVVLHIENRDTETVNGPLELTEEDKRKATVFLVELANALSAHRVA